MIQFSYPNSQFTNILGGAGVGWSMYVYNTGTTDLASIYSDVAQTIEADNPVISDSNGMFASFYWTGTVDVVIKDENGDTFDSAEGIQDLVSTILANLPETSANIPTGIASGDGDTITVTLPITADFVDLDIFLFRANTGNSGATNTPNLLINAYPSRRIRKIGGAALLEGDIVANQNCLMVYNESQDCYYLINHEATFLKRDGSAKMLGALDMDSHKVTNLTAGTAASDAIRLDQMRNHYGTATGTADAMVATIATVLSYVDGMVVEVNAPTDSWSTVSSPTININSLGNKDIVDSVGHGIGYGDIIGLVRLVYSSALDSFILTNPRFGADAVGTHHYTYSTTPLYGTLSGQGQLLDRSDYPVLWGYVSTNVDLYVSDATWVSTPADQTKFSSGNGTTSFRMPELRALVIRAWDNALGVDAFRDMASYQADQFPAHTHTYGTFSYNVAGTSGIAGGGDTIALTTNTGSTGTGTEVRVKNVALFTSIRAY